jgi:cell division protein ZapA (FtsZ GTPase activity inhibitor)
MELFYIDRQFGIHIFIEVEKGIVQRCFNDEKMTKRMNELYKGKEISFLKEDFEKRMKPTYHNVRCVATVNVHQRIEAINSRIRNIQPLISAFDVDEPTKKELREKVEELKSELTEANEELTGEKLRVLNEHNYV